MKKIGALLVGLSLMSFGCAEQPGKKKDDSAKKDDAAKKDAKSDDKKTGDKKADAEGDKKE